MLVLIAPQEFKGSLTAVQAAEAIARGLKRTRPDWRMEAIPLSDGGPGFLSALAPRVHGSSVRAPCRDALGRTVPGSYVLLNRQTETAYMEAAMANGLSGIAPDERAPLRASTEGVGDLLRAAVEAGASKVLTGVGGSATTDGGTGMARALGARFLDAAGDELPPGGGSLERLERIDWKRPEWLHGVDIMVATDVTNPLTGDHGAARVFAPQKGATPDQVELLERSLRRYAEVVRNRLGQDIASMAGGGAAGGLAAGLVAFTGAHIASGFDVVAEATGLESRIRAAGHVITGEGRYDAQSRMGKGTGRVQAMAAAANVPCTVFAGEANVPVEGVLTLESIAGERDPMRNAARLLEELAARWAGEAG